MFDIRTKIVLLSWFEFLIAALINYQEMTVFTFFLCYGIMAISIFRAVFPEIGNPIFIWFLLTYFT